MKTNFSLLFYMKKSKNYQSDHAPIYVRITVNGKRSEATTGRECDPAAVMPMQDAPTATKRKLKHLTLTSMTYKQKSMKRTGS